MLGTPVLILAGFASAFYWTIRKQQSSATNDPSRP